LEYNPFRRGLCSMVRPRDVVEQIDTLYPISTIGSGDGTGAIPVTDETKEALRRILKLASQIPDGFLPRGEERTAYERAISEIRASVHGPDRRSPYNGYQPPTLVGIREYGGLNPLVFLRKVLVQCPNLLPSEVRRRLLELVAEAQDSGKPSFNDDAAARVLDLPVDHIRRQMEICEDAGTLELVKALDGLHLARLTPFGWKELEEPETTDSGGQPIVFISCGQFTKEEIALGEALAATVDELTSCTAYFAQKQSSLEGLTTHIFDALNACVGFVAVMHHRGTVQTLTGQQARPTSPPLPSTRPKPIPRPSIRERREVSALRPCPTPHRRAPGGMGLAWRSRGKPVKWCQIT
jgi:hypothetical protein